MSILIALINMKTTFQDKEITFSLKTIQNNKSKDKNGLTKGF